MAEIKSFPNNRDEYIGAEPAMKWLHGRTSGVFAAQGCCTVAPALDTMSVTVSDGTGWLSNAEGDGIAWWISSEKDTGAKLKLRLDMADSIFPRIDRVIVSWPTTNYVALPEVKILKGAPGSNPAAPALTNSNIVRQISLASIRIPAGATRITGDMITDERLDKDVCGLVTEGAEIDTAQMQGKFDTWFAGVKNQLDGDVAGNLLNQINALRDSSATKTYADLAGIVQASYYKSGTVHVLTAQTGAKNLKFKASAAFSDGDTIRLNGVTMVARTQDGESLSGGAWAAGAVVMCFVEGSTLFLRVAAAASSRRCRFFTSPATSAG